MEGAWGDLAWSQGSGASLRCKHLGLCSPWVRSTWRAYTPQQIRNRSSHPTLLFAEHPKLRLHKLERQSGFTFGQALGHGTHQRSVAAAFPTPGRPVVPPPPSPRCTPARGHPSESPFHSVLMNRLSVFSFAFFLMACTMLQQPSCACQIKCIGVRWILT